MDLISTFETMFSGYPTYEKAWGKEIWLCNTEQYCAKLLIVEPGFQCSRHYHKIKDEMFVVLAGRLELYFQELSGFGGCFILPVGGKWQIKPGTSHRFLAPTDRAMILEISTHHDDNDVVRLEPSGPIPTSKNGSKE